MYGAGVTEELVARITMLSDDGTEADDASRQLRSELLDLDDLLASSPNGAAPPEGARSVELIAIGTLLVTVLAQPEVLAGLLEHIGGWIQRRGRGRIEIEIDNQRLIIEDASRQERRRLIEAYIEKVLKSDS